MTHSLDQKRQKAEAMAKAVHHAKNASVDELRAEQDVKDSYYHQDRKEYLEKQQEDQEAGGRNSPAVPKSMLDREYDKNPSGGYTHKKAGSYRE